MQALRFLVCEGREAEGRLLAARLGLSAELFVLPIKAELKRHAPAGAALVLEPDGLGLYALDMPGSGPVRIDLGEGSLGFRVADNRARHEMVVKACGLLKATSPLQILDATAGLLRDACVLAAAGARVQVAERSPVIAELIEDGLKRAQGQAELADLLSRIAFRPGDSLLLLHAMAAASEQVDVVYLDPMFPHRDKSALVKKEMRVFRAVVGEDADADALLAPARAVARKRVVVKRPKLAPWLAAAKPGLTLEGKSGRFDIYLA